MSPHHLTIYATFMTYLLEGISSEVPPIQTISTSRLSFTAGWAVSGLGYAHRAQRLTKSTPRTPFAPTATLLADTCITAVILSVLVKRRTGWKVSTEICLGPDDALIENDSYQVTDRLITRLLKLTFGKQTGTMCCPRRC